MPHSQFSSPLTHPPGRAWALGCANPVLLQGATRAAAPNRQVQPTRRWDEGRWEGEENMIGYPAIRMEPTITPQPKTQILFEPSSTHIQMNMQHGFRCHRTCSFRAKDGGGPQELCLLTMMSGCELTKNARRATEKSPSCLVCCSL